MIKAAEFSGLFSILTVKVILLIVRKYYKSIGNSMNIEFYFAFVITVFIASGIPGPSMLLGLTHGMRYGFKNTLYTATGNMVASSIQAIISIAGLGILIATSGTLFMIIKYIGAAYLIYLGIILWRSHGWDIPAKNDVSKKETAPKRNLFYQGFMVAAANPKAIVFFTALFPQFLNPKANSILFYIFMVTVVAVAAFTCLMVYAAGGHKIGQYFKRPNIGKLINKITGGFFIGGGTIIVLSED